MRRFLAVLALTPLLLLAAPDDKLPSDLALVPHDVLWFATVRVADVSNDARIRAAVAMLPGVPNPGKEAEKLGVKESDLDRVTLFQRRVTQGYPVAILRSLKSLDKKGIRKHLGAERESIVHGRTVNWAAPAHKGLRLQTCVTLLSIGDFPACHTLRND